MKLGAVIKALGHPIRRDVIKRLRDGPMTAGDLAEAYSVSKPTMSTHFQALKEADLIIGKKDGVSITYRLNTTVADEALASLIGLLSNQETAGADLSDAATNPNSTEQNT